MEMCEIVGGEIFVRGCAVVMNSLRDEFWGSVSGIPRATQTLQTQHFAA